MFFRKYVLATLVWFIYRILSWTWKITFDEPAELLQNLRDHKTSLFAHWHGDEIVLIYCLRRYRVATITSTSKDGEMMNTVIRLLGGKTTRGSSTRGGVSALKGLLRLLKNNPLNSSFAVDGPKGPLHKVKPGVLEVSRVLNAPIFFAGVCCSNAWVFRKSWNQTYLPKPFSKVIISWGGPLQTPKDFDPRAKELTEQLEAALHKQQAFAFKKIAAL